MNKILKSIFTIIFLAFLSVSANAQAKLIIENNSQREMTVKVMKIYNGKGNLHKTATIRPYSSKTIYFSNSGRYFTKTKAVLNGKDAIYQKGESFEVINDASGYSVMTLTFTIKESTVPQVIDGKQISKTEFDLN